MGFAVQFRVSRSLKSAGGLRAFALLLSGMMLTGLDTWAAAKLLNIDFNARLATGYVPKSGAAAVGESGDFWNVYSRDVNGEFDWRDSGQVTDLKWADGSSSTAAVSVNNAAGAWGNGAADPMFRVYLYPLSRQGNITVSLTGVPAGTYDLYIYAHGEPDTENGVVHVVSADTDYGTRGTSSAPGWNSPVWTEGQQFVLFKRVEIVPGQPLKLTSMPGVARLALINGLQLLRTNEGGPGFPPPTRVPFRVTTYSGSVPGSRDGFRTEATFTDPSGLALAPDGRIFLTEGSLAGFATAVKGAHRIRVISPDGIVTTFAGSEEPGLVDGPRLTARFAGPNDLVFDRSGNIFITDRANHRIRKIDQNGMVSTFAGSSAGYQDGVGTGAMFNTPIGLCIDRDDNLYVADFENIVVRKITPQAVVTTHAGIAYTRGTSDGFRTSATFNSPGWVASSPQGELFVADWLNGMIRGISIDGMVSTFATGWTYVESVAVDADGGVYATVPAGAGAHRFLNFNRAGNIQWSMDNPVGFQDGPVSLAQFQHYSAPLILPNGNILMSDGPRIRLIEMTPATVDLNVERELPASYSPGVKFTVALRPSASGGEGVSYVYAIEETPPAGWTVGAISADGIYDPAARTIKFGPFFNVIGQVLTYEVTPPLGENGAKTFQGVVSVNGRQTAVAGETMIASVPLHPADLNPADFRITINEMTAYAYAWRQGQNWAVGPNPIPIDYVTRAGFLWKNGESYRYDPSVSSPPAWWVSSPPVPIQTRSVARPTRASSGALATRTVPKAWVAAEPFTVRILASLSAEMSVFAVEEHVAAELVVCEITGDGVYDSANRIIKWGPYFDHSERELTYRAKCRTSSAATVAFHGAVSTDGAMIPIAGPELFTAAVRLSSLRILADGALSLSAGPADNREYQIEVSPDLQVWAPLTSVRNRDGLLRLRDPDAFRVPQRFYRAVGF